jgi:uncharacterized membrane protein YhaH (DUF805 family)
MSFGEWYVRRGRIGRRTYWLHYTLPIVALGLLAGIADGALGYPGLVSDPSQTGVIAWAGGPLELAVMIFTLAPSITSQVTRLHDRGHSAWWLLCGFVPLVGAVVLCVQCGFLRGDGGPNAYGPPEGWTGDRLGSGVDSWA